MPRPRIIQNEDLVAVARSAFLEQGVGVSTAEIARQAGISEGTLFSRFATKEDLLREAIGLSSYGHWRSELLSSVGKGDNRGQLERCAMLYLQESEQVFDVLLLVFSRGHAPEHNPLLTSLGNPLADDTAALAAYLRAETGLGRLRPLDTELTAMTITGSLSGWLWHGRMCTAEIGGTTAEDAAARDPGRFVRGLFDLLWPGMEPR
ncbi:TetR/AcrR family transcriptional regulator [Deinococcus radiophilus]|uniref:TetR/AcrR family transcriptional regulator n=1 Tax=Deinococcus radiophilus TaxID=32062 RepID=A0A431W676_9DEIO|nr:TetR/AcrR family transcriptional regulator [Deinococcus radiophilus]RTR30913.1 TetR/AcrR family transcriptional regulator [Deinococcus radiophilus]UFA49493.1 TetR/AcrR family transcriptional regulator [Deinococcus radiophilus]